MITQETGQWAAKKFGIPENEIVWYNSGICYDRVVVTTEEAAKKVQEKMKGQFANGGMYHGMPLGNYSKTSKGEFDVMC